MISLPMESLKPIAKKAFPEMGDKEIQEMLIILTDSIGKVAYVSPKNPELEKLCTAVCEYKVDRIRAMSLMDEKKAKEEARDFLKAFEEAPGLNEKYKPELKEMFTK